jgi:hypothetical protein
MQTDRIDISIYRALTTVNAPLALHIDADTLARSLRLEDTDLRWRPHVRAFFQEVDAGVIMDMVVEGTVSFDDLAHSAAYWDVEESENARWVREMASVSVAEADEADASSHRLGFH